MNLYRELDPREETAFREWAHVHYKPFTAIDGCWHPVIQDECRRINEAAGKNITFGEDQP